MWWSQVQKEVEQLVVTGHEFQRPYLLHQVKQLEYTLVVRVVVVITLVVGMVAELDMLLIQRTSIIILVVVEVLQT
jgi:hypothetical protein